MNNLLLESLDNFYDEYTINRFSDILTSTDISLRVIDWFVTNYSKKKNLILNIHLILSN